MFLVLDQVNGEVYVVDGPQRDLSDKRRIVLSRSFTQQSPRVWPARLSRVIFSRSANYLGGSASTVLGLEEKRVGCKRYPLRVRTLYLLALSPTIFTLIARHPVFGFALG
jgi:hypothetical protein